MNNGHPTSRDWKIRTALQPGDLGEIIRLHGAIYSREQGFDPTFEQYVAPPLVEFAGSSSRRERIWIAESGDRIVGCIAIVASEANDAQLRWFLVEPSARGNGLGATLLDEALQFCRSNGYRSVFLWTLCALTAAGRMYRQAGFEKTQEIAARRWGVDVVEEKYELELIPNGQETTSESMR